MAGMVQLFLKDVYMLIGGDIAMYPDPYISDTVFLNEVPVSQYIDQHKEEI